MMSQRLGQWVEIQGVGRTLNANGELSVMTREGLMMVFVGQELVSKLGHCVDSLLRIREFFWQTTKPLLLMPSARFLQIEEAAPSDPFAIPTSQIATLAGADSGRWDDRRRKIAGVVTSKRDNMVIVQDSSGGISIETDEKADINIGDDIQAVGFFRNGFPGETVECFNS